MAENTFYLQLTQKVTRTRYESNMIPHALSLIRLLRQWIYALKNVAEVKTAITLAGIDIRKIFSSGPKPKSFALRPPDDDDEDDEDGGDEEKSKECTFVLLDIVCWYLCSSMLVFVFA